MLDQAEGLLHEVQRVLLLRDVPAPPALAWAPTQGGRRLERARHPARPGRAAARLPDGLGETGVTPGLWATRASQRSRSYCVCITGEMQCPLDRTEKTISVARDRRVAPHKARTTAVSGSCKSGSVTEATAIA